MKITIKELKSLIRESLYDSFKTIPPEYLNAIDDAMNNLGYLTQHIDQKTQLYKVLQGAHDTFEKLRRSKQNPSPHHRA